MTLAGEHALDAPDAWGRLQVRAAIALSPYVNLAAAALDTRYTDIAAPGSSVTGDSDGDPLGLVEGATLRHVPFDRMGGTGKFLLSLHARAHAEFSGSAGANGSRQPPADAKLAQGKAESTDGGGEGCQRRGGKHTGSTHAGSPDRTRPGAEDRGVSLAVSAAAIQTRAIAVQGVATAFLDAHMSSSRSDRKRDRLLSNRRSVGARFSNGS